MNEKKEVVLTNLKEYIIKNICEIDPRFNTLKNNFNEYTITSLFFILDALNNDKYKMKIIKYFLKQVSSYQNEEVSWLVLKDNNSLYEMQKEKQNWHCLITHGGYKINYVKLFSFLYYDFIKLDVLTNDKILTKTKT